MKKKRQYRQIIFLVVNLLFNVQCTKQGFQPLDASLSELHIGQIGKCQGFDPLLETDDNCLSLSKLLHPTLVNTKVDSGEIKVLPSLADHWTYEGTLAVNFILKKNIRWSNSAPLQASHFIARWKNILSQSRHQNLAVLLQAVKNAHNYSLGKTPFSEVGFSSPDPWTIRVEFEFPDPRILEKLSHVAFSPEFPVVPPYAIPSVGPYSLEKSEGSSSTVFAARSEREVPFKRISISYFNNKRNAEEAFSEHIIDLLSLNEGERPTVPSINENSRFYFPSLQSVHLVLNPRKRLFSQRQVRRAFLSSIEREEFTKLLSQEHALLPSPFSPKTDLLGSQKIWDQEMLKLDTQGLLLTFSPTNAAKELAENIQAQWTKNLHTGFELRVAPSATRLIPGEAAASVLGFRERLLRDAELYRNVWENQISRNLVSAAEYVPFESSFLPWTANAQTSLANFEEWLEGKELFVLPLINLRKTVFLNPKIKGLSQDSFLLWNFSTLEASNVN